MSVMSQDFTLVMQSSKKRQSCAYNIFSILSCCILTLDSTFSRKIQWKLVRQFQSYKQLTVLQNKGNFHFCLVSSQNQCLWVPTHFAWSHHILSITHAAFRLACRLPHCRFDGDFCTTAQVPLAAEGWTSGKQHHPNRSITLPLYPPRQIADGLILFNSGAMPLGDKAKTAWPLRAATLKQQAMTMRRSGKGASGKLQNVVWNQHHCFKIRSGYRE